MRSWVVVENHTSSATFGNGNQDHSSEQELLVTTSLTIGGNGTMCLQKYDDVVTLLVSNKCQRSLKYALAWCGGDIDEQDRATQGGETKS